MHSYSDECLQNQAKAETDADYNVGDEAKTDAHRGPKEDIEGESAKILEFGVWGPQERFRG
jgi:hypothetical protein